MRVDFIFTVYAKLAVAFARQRRTFLFLASFKQKIPTGKPPYVKNICGKIFMQAIKMEGKINALSHSNNVVHKKTSIKSARNTRMAKQE